MSATDSKQTRDIASNKAFARLVEEMQRPPFHDFLRPSARHVDPERSEVVIHLPFRAEFRRDPVEDGYHGGIIAALIDLAGHAAIATLTGRPAPTVDLRIDYLRPAPGVELVALAKVLRAGRSVGRADITVIANGKTVAVGRGTFSTV